MLSITRVLSATRTMMAPSLFSSSRNSTSTTVALGALDRLWSSSTSSSFSSVVSSQTHYQQQQHCNLIRFQRRLYTPMTKEEEEQEKARVSHLSPEEKDAELRKLNREIARLESLKGINTGELYTWTGRYKALTREYGFPLMVYYFSVWASTGACLYFGLDILGVDAMQLIQKIDAQLGWSLASKVDAQLGKLGMVLVLNEMIEPVRLPFVIVTLKPVMDRISPPKY